MEPTMIPEPRRRVFVDLAPLASDGSNGGAGPLVLTLLRSLASRFRGLELHLMVKAEAQGAVEDLARAGVLVHVIGRDVDEPRRLLRTRRRTPLLSGLPDRSSIRLLGADVLFSPLFTASFHEPGLPHLAVAYDFQELTYPEFFTAPERRRRRAFRADLRRADHVIAISDATRREAIERLHLAPGRVSTIRPPVARTPLGPSELDARLRRLGLARDEFAAYPANFWPHKNHERLIGALAASPGVTLVLCGALDAGRERFLALGRELGVGERLLALPYLDEDDVTALVQGARLLVYPSLHEGFGLPVAEALALGTPVVCSRLPVLEEVTGGAAVHVDPTDVTALSEALLRVWRSGDERGRLVDAGKRAAAARAADDVPALYAALLAGLPS